MLGCYNSGRRGLSGIVADAISPDSVTPSAAGPSNTPFEYVEVGACK